jgi:pimeloyl-ACP methyl ester carboxylesterase
VYTLHGLLETATGHFGPQLRAWSHRGRAIGTDLPGHGDCPVDVDAECLPVAVGYAAALLRRFGPGRLVGASYLGGPVAVELARRHPDLVRSVVLTGVIPDVPGDVFGGWVRSIQEAARTAELAEAYRRVHGDRWPRTLAAYAADVDARYDTAVRVRWDVLAGLEMPVLVVNGAHKTAERDAARGAGDIGPRVHGVVIEDAGHIPGRDRPAAFEEAVARFWATAEESHAAA